MLDEQMLDEQPGPSNLAGRDLTAPGELLQGLRMHLEQRGGFREVERQHGTFLLGSPLGREAVRVR